MENASTSSTRYCRPVYIEYGKETTDIVNMKKKEIEEQIKNLEVSAIDLKNNSIAKIHHTVFLTMIDGKICNSITNTKTTMT